MDCTSKYDKKTNRAPIQYHDLEVWQLFLKQDKKKSLTRKKKSH